MYLNSILKGVFFVKRFRAIIRVANNSQEKSLTVLLKLRRDFVIRKLVRKQGINIHAALRRFRKI